jgi:hypothetical protein
MAQKVPLREGNSSDHSTHIDPTLGHPHRMGAGTGGADGRGVFQGLNMAKLLGWLVGWVPRRTQSKPGRDPEDLGTAFGMEAAFAPTRPVMSGEHSAPAPLDTDWAIHRLNSRSTR